VPRRTHVPLSLTRTSRVILARPDVLARLGLADDLEDFLPVHDDRLVDIHVYLHHWATARGLQRTEAEYVSATRARRPLRFLRDGHPSEEAAWRIRWVSPDLPERFSFVSVGGL
jgi:hypothetical protein